ncbi:MAG: HEAT repeat domain-containing protein [Bryobacteraceae bacterium]
MEREAWFERTLQGDYDSGEAWEAVRALPHSGSAETFAQAMEWSYSNDGRKRARGVDVLCQMYRRLDESQLPQRVYCDEAYRRIVQLMRTEQHPLVLRSAIRALGHLSDETAVPIILPYLDHSDRDIRFAVSFAMACLAKHPHAVASLLNLCNDEIARSECGL